MEGNVLDMVYEHGRYMQFSLSTFASMEENLLDLVYESIKFCAMLFSGYHGGECSGLDL